MRLLYSMASVDPARGGPTVAAHAVARALVDHGHDVTIIGHDDGARKAEVRRARYEVRLFPLHLRSWQLSLSYLWWCWRHIGEYDAVVINSLFLAHTFFVSRLARVHGVPYAIRPHGSLNVADVGRSHARAKRLYLRLVDLTTLRRAAYVFCTSEAERREVQRYRTAPVVVIALGADGADPTPEIRRERTRILFLGRLTEKKGVDLLLYAFALLRSEGERFTASVVGPADPGLRKRYATMVQNLSLQEIVELRPFADEAAKRRLFAESGVFVLPSEDENFGIAVAEALAHGLPVVVTPGVSHASAVQRLHLGVVSERTAEHVARALRHLLHQAEGERDEMSKRARAYAQDAFDWGGTADGLVSAFEPAMAARGRGDLGR